MYGLYYIRTLGILIVRVLSTLKQVIYMASKSKDIDGGNESQLGVKVEKEQCEDTPSSETLHKGSWSPVMPLDRSPQANVLVQTRKRSATLETTSWHSPKRMKINTDESNRKIKDKSRIKPRNDKINWVNTDGKPNEDAMKEIQNDNATRVSSLMDCNNVATLEETNHTYGSIGKKDVKPVRFEELNYGNNTTEVIVKPTIAPSGLARISTETTLLASEIGALEEQIYATLYGQCIGDAIGLLTEFMSKENALKYYGHKKELEYTDKVGDRHRKRWEVGDWTDDSDQMILIMQSLIDEKGVVNPHDFARRLVKWMEKGLHELGDNGGLGIGHTTYITITTKGFETNPHKISKNVWEDSGRFLAPNGGVMRTSILGIHAWWDTNQVYGNTIDICRTTHFDPRCQASAVSVCVAISLMLQRGDRHYKNGEYIIKTIIEDALRKASTCLEKAEEKEELEICLQCEDLSILKLDEVSSIGYTYKCLGAGFWALKQTDFRRALQEIVMSGGDADTNGAVAGALLGCKLGSRKCFPESWLQLKHREWLDKLIQKYLEVLKKKQEEWKTQLHKSYQKTTVL